jgi:hypothetical protein
MPALVAKPRMRNTNAKFADVAFQGVTMKALKAVLPASAVRIAKPMSSRKKLTCVIAAYQTAALRTVARSACSVRTRTVEAMAMSSQNSRKETTSAAAATSCIDVRKTARAVHDVRDAEGPWT